MREEEDLLDAFALNAMLDSLRIEKYQLEYERRAESQKVKDNLSK